MKADMTSSSNIVVANPEKAILFGRGGASNNNVGNHVYQKLCAKRSVEYLNCTKRKEKTSLAWTILNELKSQGVQFFKKKDSKSDCWIQAEDEECRKKISQRLRELALLAKDRHQTPETSGKAKSTEADNVTATETQTTVGSSCTEEAPSKLTSEADNNMTAPKVAMVELDPVLPPPSTAPILSSSDEELLHLPLGEFILPECFHHPCDFASFVSLSDDSDDNSDLHETFDSMFNHSDVHFPTVISFNAAFQKKDESPAESVYKENDATCWSSSILLSRALEDVQERTRKRIRAA